MSHTVESAPTAGAGDRLAVSVRRSREAWRSVGMRPRSITPRALVHSLLIVAALVRRSLEPRVLLGIFFHAFSASPGIKLYARQIARLGAGAPKNEEVSQMSRA